METYLNTIVVPSPSDVTDLYATSVYPMVRYGYLTLNPFSC